MTHCSHMDIFKIYLRVDMFNKHMHKHINISLRNKIHPLEFRKHHLMVRFRYKKVDFCIKTVEMQ